MRKFSYKATKSPQISHCHILMDISTMARHSPIQNLAELSQTRPQLVCNFTIFFHQPNFRAADLVHLNLESDSILAKYFLIYSVFWSTLSFRPLTKYDWEPFQEIHLDDSVRNWINGRTQTFDLQIEKICDKTEAHDPIICALGMCIRLIPICSNAWV